MNVLSVGRSVCLSSALWKNGGSDPDAVWHRKSDGSRDEAGSGVLRYFWGRIWGVPLYPMETLRRTCATVPRRGPLPKLHWANLFMSIMPSPTTASGGIMFLSCPSVRVCVCLSGERDIS